MQLHFIKIVYLTETRKEVCDLPETWTGNLIGRMHNKGITYDDLAEEMGVGKAYISMILNGKRKPPNIRERMESAFQSVVSKKAKEGHQ